MYYFNLITLIENVWEEMTMALAVKWQPNWRQIERWNSFIPSVERMPKIVSISMSDVGGRSS
jgi:hypothetical protein